MSVMKIVQCWDDGVTDDIRVIEILRKYGAKASFNLNYALHKPERGAGWRFKDVKDVWRLGRDELTDVYEGFLVANHTATHPWLTRISASEAAANIRDGRDALEQHFGYPILGFAYPFGDYDAAVEDMVRAAGHVYARTTKNVDHVFPPENPMAFHANCHFLAADFWDRYSVAEAAGDDSVFYFWGHSYEIVTEADWEAFDAKIGQITDDPDAVWTDLPALFTGAYSGKGAPPASRRYAAR